MGAESLQSAAIPTYSNSVSDVSTVDTSPVAAAVASKKRIKIIAIKSIGHAITSSFAALYYAYGGRAGYDTWTLFVIAGMHLWFNVRLEVYFCPVEPRAMKTRNEREREVRVGRAEECAQM
jgi:hypothetical protein